MVLIPDFTQYSLALYEGGRLIHSSVKGGLHPLWEALEQHRGRSGLILHDKVIGLAAARLVVHYGMISEIFTMVASLPAVRFLEGKGVQLAAFETVAGILTKDKSRVCPGEIIALHTDDPEIFLHDIKTMLERMP